MPDREAFLLNAYESTLSGAMNSTTDTMAMTDVTGLSVAPGGLYLVIDPEDIAKREYVWVSAIVSNNLTASERYLAGSAAGSGISHDAGAVVRMSAMGQHIEDLHDRVDADAAIEAAHEADVANPHSVTAAQTSAATAAQGTAADAHSAAASPHTGHTTDAEHTAHTGDTANPHSVTAAQASAAPASHKGSTATADHPEATPSVRGFMSAADKTKLDTYTGPGSPQTHTAGVGISITGEPNPTISHLDTSSQASVSNVAGTVIEDVTLDTFGHITALGSRNLSPGDIGAAATAHGTHVTANSVTHDDIVTKYAQDVSTTITNIGTGITPLVTPSLVMPSAGVVLVHWGFRYTKSSSGSGINTLTVLPRNDGANMSTYFRPDTIEIPASLLNGDAQWISGTAFQVFGGADTSAWSLFIAKSGSDTYDFQDGYIFAHAIPV